MISLIVVCITVLTCTAIIASSTENCRRYELQRQEARIETIQLQLAAEKLKNNKEENK